MQTLIVLGVVGFFAQLVDGALGMAYGTTSTTLALAVGLSPAVASATVHALAGEHRLSARPRKSGDLLDILAALLVGGIIAAPIAAWLVRLLSPRLPGACVGGMIVVTNARTIMDAAGASGPVRALVYVVLGAVWVTAIALVLRAHRRHGVPLTSQQWVGQPASSEAAG